MLIKKYTWFKTGGIVKNFLKPKNIEDLKNFLLNNSEKFLILGAGSNILISDEGFNGTIIRSQLFLKKIFFVSPLIIYVEAGILDNYLSIFAANHSIANFEFLYTIPGTIGGAIRMNAGCFGREIKDILISVTCLNEYGKEVTLTKEECGFTYRNSKIPKNFIILNCLLQGELGEKQKIFNYMKFLEEEKEKNQPIGIPSLGSVFKNPLPFFAWKLIDEIGFRGFQYKSVMISSKHTNFIVHNPNYNIENILSNDFIFLTKLVQEKVLEKFSISLELEVQII